MRGLWVAVVSGLSASVMTLALAYLWLQPASPEARVDEQAQVPAQEIVADNADVASVPSEADTGGRAAQEREQIVVSVRQLSSRLEAVEQQLEGIDTQVAALETRTEEAIASSEAVSGAFFDVEEHQPGAVPEGFPQGFSGGPAESLAESLEAAGMPTERAEEIESRDSQFQLARLELLDQATREDWADTDAFAERMSELEKSRPDLRAELGDEDYDRYLFESGNYNRLVIDSVITGSAASEAGLQPGDVLNGYAGSRVFQMSELQAATREGNRGDVVQLDVVRDGSLISLSLPRGPMGVTLAGSRSEPDPS